MPGIVGSYQRQMPVGYGDSDPALTFGASRQRKTAGIAMTELTTMVDAYLEAGLWSSTDFENGDAPLDGTYGIYDTDDRSKAEADCRDFAEANYSDLMEASSDWAQHGHDFLLTRDGHGAGFWDRGYGAVGDRLTQAAKVYGDSGFMANGDKFIIEGRRRTASRKTALSGEEYDLSICYDCYATLANGGDYGPDGQWYLDGSDTPSQFDPLSKLPDSWHVFPGDQTDEFSSRSCDGCGSNLGGARYSALGIDPKTSAKKKPPKMTGDWTPPGSVKDDNDDDDDPTKADRPFADVPKAGSEGRDQKGRFASAECPNCGDPSPFVPASTFIASRQGNALQRRVIQTHARAGGVALNNVSVCTNCKMGFVNTKTALPGDDGSKPEGARPQTPLEGHDDSPMFEGEEIEGNWDEENSATNANTTTANIFQKNNDSRREAARCTACGGAGYTQDEDKCSDCKGTGFVGGDVPGWAKDATRRTAMPAPADVGVGVGSFFYTSWGYDQTNVDFYEVVGLTPKSVKVRRVSKDIVGGDDGPAGNSVVPNPGDYVGGEFTALLLDSGYRDAAIKAEGQYAWLWDGVPKYMTASGWGH